MADPGVPIFRGGSGSDCEEFVRAVSAYAFESDRTKDDEWIAAYAGTRLSGKALRWYVRQDKAVKLDWSALQVALLDQYPPSDEDDDDDDDEADRSKAQPLPKNVPTPAAAAGPSAGVITIAASAPIPPSAKNVSISGCKKARIRVEDKDGTAKGWVLIHKGLLSADLTNRPGEALHVKADKVNSGPTTLRILNVDGWSHLSIKWSTVTFNAKDGNQSGHLKACSKAGQPIFLSMMDALIGGQCLPEVWDIGDAGVITSTWRDPGGSSAISLGVSITSQDRLVFYSTQIPQSAQRNHVKLFYEPIE